MPSRPAAVIFDMDGLLLDSERLARQAFDQACLAVGVQVPPDVYLRCVGSNRQATAAILVEALASEDDYLALDRHWEQLYHALISEAGVPIKAGARELLSALERDAIPRALVTSTSRPTATMKLERTELISYFSCLICGGETDRGKPHPDPYLAAVTALGVPPASAWALEDSENGVRAALAAGLQVIQVPDLVAPSAELLALGHVLADDLFEVLGRLQHGQPKPPSAHARRT